MAQKYFKSGEFARFCGTTKDTLFHYDDIKLLCPAKIGSNGYRYYSINQAMLFDMISMLKEVGMSLDEIKEYMRCRDTQTFLLMLKEKDKMLLTEIERLKRLRKLLKNTMNITQDSFNVEENKIEFVDKPEEYFIVTPGQKKNDDKSVLDAISRHIKYCDKHNFFNTFTYGEIIGEQNIADGTFKTLYYCTKIDKRVNNRHLLVKPAGHYAVKYIRGSYDDLIAAYADFCRELGDLGYTIAGNIYEEDLLNYLSETDFNDYLMQIEIRVIPVKHS